MFLFILTEIIATNKRIVDSTVLVETYNMSFIIGWT